MKRSRILLLLALCWCVVVSAQTGRGKLKAAELFLDTDPGQGAGISLVLQGGINDAVRTAIQSVYPSLTPGLHTLNIRMQDSLGNWGRVFKTVLSIENLKTARSVGLAFGRAFWDDDSTHAAGMVFLNGSAADAVNSFVNAAPFNATATPGLHKLNIQLMDATGSYGARFTTTVNFERAASVDHSIKVYNGRTWFDNDVAAAIPFIAFDGAFDTALETVFASINAPSLGLHMLNVQLADSSNGWGVRFRRSLVVENPIAYRNVNISAAQLYWDNDTTRNTTLLLAFDGNFSDAVETAAGTLNVSAISRGIHRLCIRFMDVAGNYGKPFTTTMNVESPAISRSIRLVQGEVRIDNNPSVQIIALNGNFNQALEQLQGNFIASGISIGLHQLNFRIKGADSNWGPFFKTAVLISPCASTPHPTVTISGPTAFCAGDSIQLQAPIGFNSYQWVSGNTIVGTARTFSAKVSGIYRVVVTDSTNCPGPSDSVIIDVHHPVVSISGATDFCANSTDTLVATPGFQTYAWSSGSGNDSVFIQSGGNYSVIATDNLGCTASASFSANALPLPAQPVIHANGPLSFCPGANVQLTSSVSGNIRWNTGTTATSLLIDTSGTYSVTVTGSNGCSNSSAVVRTLKFPAASAYILPQGPITVCADSIVRLTANTSSAYGWSNSGVPAGTTPAINVTVCGSYYVTVTDSDGCIATSSPVAVTVHPMPPKPLISSSGPLDFCNGGHVVLTSSYSGVNRWSSGEVAGSISVNRSGVFTDTAVTVFGCASVSDPVTIIVHPTATVTSTGPQHFCDGGTDTLVAHPDNGVTYRWFNGSISQRAVVSTAMDSAWVVVTEIAQGCSDTVYFDVHPLPVGTVAAIGPTTFCYGGNVVLTTSGDSHTFYQWYKDGTLLTNRVWSASQNGYVYVPVTGYTFSADATGDYSAMIIDTLTGCRQFTNSIHVTVNRPDKPVITANGGTTICIGANSVLMSTSAVSYAWSNGGSTQSITATTEGYYWLTITDANGCSRTSDSTLITFFPIASITTSRSPILCQGEKVSLTAHPSGTYSWSVGSTAATLDSIGTAGIYRVVVRDLNGCPSDTVSVQVVVNSLPSGSISAISSTPLCFGVPIVMTAFGDPNTVFKWNFNGSPILYRSTDQYGSISYYHYESYSYSSGPANTWLPYGTGGFSATVIDTLTGCRSVTSTIAITVNSLPSATFQQTAFIACHNGSGAAVSVTGTGGVGPYQYAWSTGASGPSVSGLIAGAYGASITDQNGCRFDTSYTIAQPTPVDPVLSSPVNTRNYNVSCYGAADGTIHASAGGTPPYTYSWSTGSTAATLTGARASGYSLTMTDANGCVGTGSILLREPTAVQAQISAPVFIGGHSIRCHGDSSRMTASGSGGTGPFTFQWNTGEDGAISGFHPAGNYSVVASDSAGCSVTVPFTLTEPTSLNATLQAIDHAGYGVSCNGSTDGAITTLVTGGISPYRYVWNDTVYTPSRSHLEAGRYGVTVMDTNDCSRFDTIRITEPSSVHDSSFAVVLNCYGDSNGVAGVIPSGGDPGYSYYWDTHATTSILTGLIAGSYYVTITDSRGCTAQDLVTVTQPQELRAYAFGTYIECGSQIGLLSGSATGGNGPYSFLWSNHSNQAYQTNIPVGNYSLTVTDSHGCSDTATTRILNPPVLVGGISAVDDSALNRSILTIQVSGGVTPYMYLWSDGHTGPTDTVSLSISRTYTVIVTDANGCTSTGTIHKGSAICSLAVTESMIPVSCFGGSDGSATLIVSGGTAPYSLAWPSLSQTSATVSGLQAGTYTYQVSDAAGCLLSDTLSIPGPARLIVTSQYQPITCYGDATIITLQVNGGTPPYAGTFADTVHAGIATHTITDANGCLVTRIDTVVQPPMLTISSLTVSTPIACYGGTGCVTVSAVGGTAPYYGTGLQCAIPEGTTSMTVIDASGCHVNSDISLVAPSKLVLTTSSIPSTCGSANGTATVIASGGTPAFSYVWSTGATTASIGTLTGGTYTVITTDANGCTASASETVQVQGTAPTAPGPISGPYGACRGSNITFSIAPVNGASSYAWSLPAGSSGSSTGTSITVNFSNTYNGGFICVRSVSACGISGMTCLNVPAITGKPSGTGSISGPLLACGPNTYTYSISNYLNATAYNWSVSGTGLSIVSGNGTNSIRISTVQGFVQGVISVTPVNCIGSAATRTFAVYGIPYHSSPLYGPVFVCPGTLNVGYSIAHITSATSYSWAITGDATVIASNNEFCTVNFGSRWNGGIITATTYNACGSFSRNYTLYASPVQPGGITGPATDLCNKNNIQYSIAAVTGATSYNWTVPAGATITQNQGTSIKVNFNTFSGIGAVCVRAVNACGAGPYRCMSVTSAPAAPAAISGPLSVCKSLYNAVYGITAVTGATGYSWSISGGAGITGGGTSANVDFTSATSSSAVVKVIAGNACGISQPTAISVAVNLSCRQDLESVHSPIMIFPNPTGDELNITYWATESGPASIELLNTIGQIVFKSEVMNTRMGSGNLRLSLKSVGLVPGLYLLRYREGDRVAVVRIVVE